jgi:hypothetical protein
VEVSPFNQAVQVVLEAVALVEPQVILSELMALQERTT